MSLKRMWSKVDTDSLISSVESRYNDLRDIQKRKTFWNEVCEDLASQNIHYTQASCKKKWLNLIRTYKAATDNKIKTGKDPLRFPFYNRLDALLTSYSDIDLNKSNLIEDSTDFENNEHNDIQTETDTSRLNLLNGNGNEYDDYSSDDSSPIELCKKRKLSNSENESLLQLKKQYYENKEKLHRMFIEESLKIKREKLQLQRASLQFQERTAIALETLAQNKNVE